MDTFSGILKLAPVPGRLFHFLAVSSATSFTSVTLSPNCIIDSLLFSN